MAEFERIVDMSAAYDKRSADPRKDYGIHGMELRFVLKGLKGATQFVIFTNWPLPHIEKDTEARIAGDPGALCLMRQLPADVGYHSPTPRYEGQNAIHGDCPFVGGPCFYDGSSLQAQEWFEDGFLQGGTEWLWARLERFYRETFEEPER